MGHICESCRDATKVITVLLVNRFLPHDTASSGQISPTVLQKDWRRPPLGASTRLEALHAGSFHVGAPVRSGDGCRAVPVLGAAYRWRGAPPSWAGAKRRWQPAMVLGSAAPSPSFHHCLPTALPSDGDSACIQHLGIQSVTLSTGFSPLGSPEPFSPLSSDVSLPTVTQGLFVVATGEHWGGRPFLC